MKRRNPNLLDFKSQSIIEYHTLAFPVEISSKDQQSKHALSAKIPVEMLPALHGEAVVLAQRSCT